jgi:hypothetical protein
MVLDAPTNVLFRSLLIPASGVWQLVFEPLAVSVGLASPLQGTALFHAGIFGWTKNVVVLLLGIPNHALLPQ